MAQRYEYQDIDGHVILLFVHPAELLQSLGAWGEKVACGRRTIGTLRTTYLVNEEGIIERIFTPKEIKTKIHAEQILNAIKQLTSSYLSQR